MPWNYKSINCPSCGAVVGRAVDIKGFEKGNVDFVLKDLDANAGFRNEPRVVVSKRGEETNPFMSRLHVCKNCEMKGI